MEADGDTITIEAPPTDDTVPNGQSLSAELIVQAFSTYFPQEFELTILRLRNQQLEQTIRMLQG